MTQEFSATNYIIGAAYNSSNWNNGGMTVMYGCPSTPWYPDGTNPYTPIYPTVPIPYEADKITPDMIKDAFKEVLEEEESTLEDTVFAVQEQALFDYQHKVVTFDQFIDIMKLTQQLWDIAGGAARKDEEE